MSVSLHMPAIPLLDGWNEIVAEGIKPLEDYLETGVVPYMMPVATNNGDIEMEVPKQKASIFRHKRYMELYL